MRKSRIPVADEHLPQIRRDIGSDAEREHTTHYAPASNGGGGNGGGGGDNQGGGDDDQPIVNP